MEKHMPILYNIISEIKQLEILCQCKQMADRNDANSIYSKEVKWF